MNNHPESRRISILRDSVARRIAAGEVIDRPQAVVRELLDNSIDAGSTEISLFIRNGGIEEVRVVDNGSGMDEDNLQRCFLPHATSKITDFEDIYRTKTLGFRGEALSSIAACSKLTIISSTSDELAARKLDIQDGRLRSLSEYRGTKGTVISVRDLFYSMPGRKNFLKSPSAESAMCRSMFIEKALPHLDVSFRYFVDDDLKLFLPASDLKTRIQSAFGSLFHGAFLEDFSTDAGEFLLTAAAGTFSLYRKDRKYIQIFINKRRISDYSLVQAVDYAYSSFLPGGCHPVCFLFLDIPPAHIDFNIHPAKREVKFLNLPSIHHSVTAAFGSFLNRSNSFDSDFRQTSKVSVSPESRQTEFRMDPEAQLPARSEFRSRQYSDSIFKKESLPEIAAELDGPFEKKTISTGNEAGEPLVYLGQLFKLFLIFEYGRNLLLIDQHAAHERLIFNQLSETKPKVQDLLVPISLTLEKDQEAALEKSMESYTALGFDLQKNGPGDWLINSMPAACSGMEDEITAVFRSRIQDATKLKKELFAMISCRSAIKDGDRVDDISAVELASSILKLDNPRCPHGRPVIQLISRDRLFEMFGRTF